MPDVTIYQSIRERKKPNTVQILTYLMALQLFNQTTLSKQPYQPSTIINCHRKTTSNSWKKKSKRSSPRIWRQFHLQWCRRWRHLAARPSRGVRRTDLLLNRPDPLIWRSGTLRSCWWECRGRWRRSGSISRLFWWLGRWRMWRMWVHHLNIPGAS